MNIDSYNLPISQYFHSIQGEGSLVGTPMTFMRTAGCCVGNYTKPSLIQDPELQALRVLNPQHSICRTALGQQFLCDTDYHTRGRRSIDSLLDDAKGTHICITGGEPLMYDLMPLILAAHARGFQVQIETSGTITIGPELALNAWITCSPKDGYLPCNTPFVDEFKFVLSQADFADKLQTVAHIQRILDCTVEQTWERFKPKALVYLQPVNNVETVDVANVASVLELLWALPEARLSVQLHKLLGLE